MSVRLGSVPSSKPLVTLVMDDDLLKQIDDFRFTRRFASRAAAIKFLLTKALQAVYDEDERAPN